MLKIKELDTEIFEKIIANIHNISQKKCGFKKFIEDLNTYLFTLKDDYLKILQQDSEPYKNIQQHIIESIAHKAFIAKVNNKITTKKEFRILIHQINLGILFTDNLNYIVEKILIKAYEKYLSQKSYKDITTKVNHQKDIYAKRLSSLTTLHITRPGIILGITKSIFTLKENGKVIKKNS